MTTTAPQWTSWNQLPPDLQREARQMWGEATRTHTPHVPEPLRAVETPGGHVCIDPVWVSRYNRIAHKVIGHRQQEPEYAAWRTQQLLLNLPHLRWGLTRGAWRGRACHIVAGGPSNRLAAGGLPPRSDRQSKVIAINGALELVRDADLWFVADALQPGNSAWQPYPWLARVNPADTVGVFRVAARHELTRAVAEAHFYLPTSQEHRDLIRPEVEARLPAFIEGMQALCPAIHLAWWLGADPIVLWGADQGKPSPRTRYYGAPSTPIGRDRGPWHVVPGVEGRKVLSTAHHLEAASQVAGAAMWLADAGARVWNCSQGVDYIFAPYMPPRAALEITDPSAYSAAGSASETLAAAPVAV